MVTPCLLIIRFGDADIGRIGAGKACMGTLCRAKRVVRDFDLWSWKRATVDRLGLVLVTRYRPYGKALQALCSRTLLGRLDACEQYYSLQESWVWSTPQLEHSVLYIMWRGGWYFPSGCSSSSVARTL